MSHYVTNCKHGKTLSQCRCPSPNKDVRIGPCPPECGEGDLTQAQKDALRLLLATGVLTVTRRISSSVPSPGFGDLMMQGDDQGRVRYYLKGAYGGSADVTDEVARYIEEHGTRGVAISADYQQAIDRELT